MMITDPFVVKLLHPSKWLQYGIEGFFLIGVLVAGKLWLKHRISRAEKEEKEVRRPPSSSFPVSGDKD
jgi:hypothetical protein